MPVAPDRAVRAFQRGLRLRAEQRTEDACDAIGEAVRLAPDDPAFALTHARINYETWRPSATLFERAIALAPGDFSALSGLAAAFAVEGRADAADALLTQTLARHPGWLAGHKQLVSLRRTTGAADDADRSFRTACDAEPENVALRLAWFHALVVARDWPAARRVVAEGVQRLGDLRAFTLARIFVASESDEASTDPGLFDAVADVQDVGLDLARTRFFLRNRLPNRAAAIAEGYAGGAAARTFWPYLSLAWRLLGDRRVDWLDGAPPFITAIDLSFSPKELQRLGTVLRGLLTMTRPIPEQSVRGGVQTDRHLFFNPDPAIQAARRRATAAVRAYVDALPPPDPRHPLLSPARDKILYDGSWAVLLEAKGAHAAHTHVRGWISSALHIELADRADGDREHGGWIEFGAPPNELALDLAPTLRIEPRAGSLVLFPSTTWHQTAPFDSGQRLTLAFDVSRQEAA